MKGNRVRVWEPECEFEEEMIIPISVFGFFPLLHSPGT